MSSILIVTQVQNYKVSIYPLILGITYLSHFINQGWNVILFDYTGSGLSDGDIVSLGYFESFDLDLIIKNVA